MNSERFAVAPAPMPADNNIRHQYPIHKGQWVRHPDVTATELSFCRYTLEFELEQAMTIEAHVTADNRFELTCDGQYIGMGPDRSDLEHWSFHSYRIALEAGKHELAADVHYLGLSALNRPWAQTCIEPGFVFYCEDAPVDLNTGSAPWKATKLSGVGTHKVNLKAFMVVGPNYTIDAKAYFNSPVAVEVVGVRAAGDQCETGKINPGWKLYPSRMPEQVRNTVRGGKIRFVGDVEGEGPFPDADAPNAPTPARAWQAMVDGDASLSVPANTRLTVLWDLDEYHTAYPQLTTTGGAGASVSVDWAESCYVHPLDAQGKAIHEKANRNEFVGKYFRGNGDAFLPDGKKRTFRAFWWRAGRWVRLTVKTADQPLTIEDLHLLETRMPLENQGTFTSSDADLAPIISLATRGIQMCAHETYMDCPYYEQMMYTGDTRLQVLTSFVMSDEDRLNQRTLELFDWSRQETGFVHERYPSQPKQLSCTFAMIWVLMVRDYAWWRADPAFVRQRLKGVRCMLEEFKLLPDAHAPLLPALPGWSFIDWVPGLSMVNHPGRDDSVSAITSLLFLNALVAAAELEDGCGEAHLAQYNREWADRLAEAIDKTFWNEDRGLFADTPDHDQYSEHAQCLALLSSHFPHRQSRCFDSLITHDDLLRTTVYFSFYLLETFAKFGRGDLIIRKLDFWKGMTAMGMRTPVEMPEPSRSDCHAWGSHPLFHMHASLAGVRPAAPGFSKVSITPQPGSLTELNSAIPHPAGDVSLTMKQTRNTWQTKVCLPAGIDGTLQWQGQTHAISRETRLDLPAG